MPNIYRTLAVLASVCALAAAGYDYHRVRGELATAREAAKSARQAEQKVRTVVVYREKLRAATAAESASAAASVASALAQNPAWADQPVPQEVQDALAP